ncbi:proteinase-activated receptor 1-like [Seriola lalandi dorsalis]|uniref:Proteinase-activated receptor 1 n=1 Tax=Seriola lalandi dorsalis TaxID=1841481 RepID=A0A3B4XP66_SERLL|nr:proteinase-activated receptor 1-like [Seriola lalandi dorsalis]XP_056259699.1 proteinase-activated receptor 1-like [Seriola aureovittata]
MFPKFLRTLLVVAVCARAASAVRNDTVRLRTFGLYERSFTAEPIPLDYIDQDNVVTRFNNSTDARVANKTNTSRMEVSEEALQFLTGPLSTVLIPSFYTLVFLISVPINICAVVAFSLKIRPKKTAAIYMLNLACADLLFAVLLPFKITYHFGGNNWIFGPLMCRVVTAAFYWNMYCSVLLIACISVDRLLAVVYPIDSLSWRRPRNSIIACAAMWILSFVGTLPLVLSDQTVRLSQLNIITCHDVQPAHKLMWHYKLYFITLCCTLFFLPLLVTVVSYARVIWSLSRVPRGVVGRLRRRTRAVVMALTVLVIFVLCFTPTNCLLLAHYLQFNEGVTHQENPDGSYAAYLVFMCLGSLNCLLDPLVYYFGSSQCQRQLSSMLRCQKTSGGSSFSHSSSDSCRSSSRAILKSSRIESSKIHTTVTGVDSSQENLNSQYKKLLV